MSASVDQVVQEAERLARGMESARRRPVERTIAILAAAAERLRGAELRRSLVPRLAETTRESAELVEAELDLVCGLLQPEYLRALVERELGDARMLDGWVHQPEVSIRRHPRGLVLHNLSGNALIVAPLSIANGLLTKNVNLVKASSEEPVFASAFAEVLFEVAPELRAEVSVLQWSGSDQTIYEALFPALDAAVHWGGEESHRAMARLAAEHEVALLSHGPKISFAYLDGASAGELPAIAAGLARDVVLWEQRACASARFVFVHEGAGGANASAVAESLAAALSEVSRQWPVSADDAGRAARVAALRQRYKLQLGMRRTGRVYASAGSEWTVILSESPPDADAINQCMDRVIWVSPVGGDEAVLEFLARGGRPLRRLLQVMAYHGHSEALVDAVTRLGVARIARPGEMSLPSPGASHDGGYNLVALTTIHSSPVQPAQS